MASTYRPDPRAARYGLARRALAPELDHAEQTLNAGDPDAIATKLRDLIEQVRTHLRIGKDQ